MARLLSAIGRCGFTLRPTHRCPANQALFQRVAGEFCQLQAAVAACALALSIGQAS